MTCNRYEYQLSLHLDGRLSSARRDALMQHLAHCDSCEALWLEFRTAQDLALSLPPQSVSHGFRDTLLARMQSGEGTPEAVFREPFPKLAKLRYLASGAAAAAVIVLSLNWFTDQEGRSKGLMRIDPSRTGTLASGGSWNPEALGIRSFIPVNVAEAGARSVTDSVRDLQYQTADLKSRVDHTPPRQLLQDKKFAEIMSRARGSVGLMRWMQDGRIISLPTRFDSELRLTETILNQLQSAESPAEFRFALGGLNQLQIGHMRDNFQVICCQKPEEFLGRFRSAMIHNPDIGRVLRVQVTETHGFQLNAGTGGKKNIWMKVRIERSK